MNLRARIATAAGLAVALTVIAAAAVVYVGVRAQLRDDVDRGLERRAELLVSFTTRLALPEQPRVDEQDLIGRLGASSTEFGEGEGFAQLIKPNNRVLSPPDQAGLLPTSPSEKEIARIGTGRSIRNVLVDGTRLRVLTVGAGSRGAVQVARPLTATEETLDRVLTILALVSVGGIALGAALGAVVAQTALAPIARFTRLTEEVAAEPKISRRIDDDGSDELGRLARSFNSTLQALEQSLEAQRLLVADASHELRTPIASLKANIQTLEQSDRLSKREAARLRVDIVEELDRLTDLVSDVVELARGAPGVESLDEIRLDRLVAEIAEHSRRHAGDRITISLALKRTVVRGDRERIGRAVSNMLDNAVKWSPDGGTVKVTLASGVLRVRDVGPGFSKEDLPHIFDRFYRSEAARDTPGSGLGLAIVKQTAEAHGGWVKAKRARGGGALLEASFGDLL